eukprot:CAMPEP_0174258112 /NCGR_PEP_ID=MMETSP0439-20130205/7170_1 /TAXON_ID=0 /ORGANISM="Stereomyxa ramosa, Strain Chinc5" /LENGTH=190 /DNA_ID=CAMNT_0015341493 /DNA_START=34 /DNA_END=606 /DNA_ORIENTATION=+
MKAVLVVVLVAFSCFAHCDKSQGLVTPLGNCAYSYYFGRGDTPSNAGGIIYNFCENDVKLNVSCDDGPLALNVKGTKAGSKSNIYVSDYMNYCTILSETLPSHTSHNLGCVGFMNNQNASLPGAYLLLNQCAEKIAVQYVCACNDHPDTETNWIKLSPGQLAPVPESDYCSREKVEYGLGWVVVTSAVLA